MAVKNFMDLGLQRLDRTRGRETEIEQYGDITRYHVGRASAAVDIGDLPGGVWKILVAVVPFGSRQLCDRRGRKMDGVFCQMRIGDMALYPFDDQRSRQGAAPAVLDGIPKRVHASRLPND